MFDWPSVLLFHFFFPRAVNKNAPIIFLNICVIASPSTGTVILLGVAR